jgi:dTDP-4-amino-4,6-dideoxygalactose transaminase
MSRVLERGWFILGPEVEAFEQAFAAYLSVNHVVGVANGTDALQLALLAQDIQPGDEVICPALTAAPTALAILAAGAYPVFADVDPQTYTLDPQHLAACLSERTRAIMPVHLYGLAADLTAITEFAAAHDLVVIEDAAQAHGARFQDQPLGTIGALGCFSFYPTKNMGALGDGGAVATDDDGLADSLRQLRNLGQDGRFNHVCVGLNSRLDELQAAILRVKLAHLDADNAARHQIADWYRELLADVDNLILPYEPDGCRHAYHLFVVQHPQRDALRAYLASRHIGTDVHYPKPLHQQPAFAPYRTSPQGLPAAERLAGRILSLPNHPRLTRSQVERAAEAIHDYARDYRA